MNSNLFSIMSFRHFWVRFGGIIVQAWVVNGKLPCSCIRGWSRWTESKARTNFFIDRGGSRILCEGLQDIILSKFPRNAWNLYNFSFKVREHANVCRLFSLHEETTVRQTLVQVWHKITGRQKAVKIHIWTPQDVSAWGVLWANSSEIISVLFGLGVGSLKNPSLSFLRTFSQRTPPPLSIKLRWSLSSLLRESPAPIKTCPSHARAENMLNTYNTARSFVINVAFSQCEWGLMLYSHWLKERQKWRHFQTDYQGVPYVIHTEWRQRSKEAIAFVTLLDDQCVQTFRIFSTLKRRGS